MSDSEQFQFQAMIAGLEHHGISQQEIARRTGVSRATVWRMANGMGRSHRYSTDFRIEELHRKVVGRLDFGIALRPARS